MKKQTILLLTDLKEGSKNILGSTVLLAQKIHAEIKVLHIKRPVDVVKQESQLSAIRALNKEHNVISKKIKDLIEPFKKENDVVISTSFSIGNIKNEVLNQIQEIKPDMIVLGKRKTGSLKIMGDKLTEFILNNFTGEVMIPGKDNSIELDENANFGVVNSTEQFLNNELSKRLLDSNNNPLKKYRVIDTLKSTKNDSLEQKKTIEYAFERSDNALQNLSNYVNKHRIDLLFVDRNGLSNDRNSATISTDVKQLVNKTTVPVLIS